jgi:isopentenyl diphosphate isomerase/L-lactate dehydrogenase-like FMN-dependent dehydrogenase
VGRPYLWGLGAYGEEGVDKVLSILQAEFERSMKFAGAVTLDSINREHVWIDD